MATSNFSNIISQVKAIKASMFSEDPLRRELYDAIQDVLPCLESPQDTINRIAYSVSYSHP